MSDTQAANATVEDNLRSMLALMKRGAVVSLTGIPNDPTFLSSHIAGGTAQAIAERVEAALSQVSFTLSDASRLMRKEDVQGACPHPDDCFYEGGPVRCGPCAVKASAAKGIEINDRHSHLPEVCRIRREVKAAQVRIAELEASPSPQANKTACSAAGAQLDADHSEVFTSDISEQKDVCVAHTRQLREQTNVVVVQDADQTKRKAAVFDAVKCVADHKVAHIDAPIGTLARPLESVQTDAHQAAPQTNLRGDGEAAVIECLAAGQNFVFDPSTNFLHADDGTVQGIRYIAEHGDMPHMPWPASEWAIDRISKLEAALKKVADMLDAEDADLDDAISIASAALTTEGQPDGR